MDMTLPSKSMAEITEVWDCPQTSLAQSLQVYAFARIFTDFQGLIWVYRFYGIFNVILGKFIACFFMEKQAINFPKIVHNARSCCQV